MGGASRNYLWQRNKFFDCFAFGDSFWTEAHIDLLSTAGDHFFNQLGNSGVNRASQHQVLPVFEYVEKLSNRIRHDFRIRIQMFINWCADHYDHVFSS